MVQLSADDRLEGQGPLAVGQIKARLAELSGLADPLADQVQAELHEASAAVRALLSQGMRHGVATIASAPESFKRFLQDAEATIAEATPTDLTRACETYLLIAPIWASIALGPGSLVHTYADEDIATVLTRTGALSGETAARRLLETSVWNLQVIRPNGLTVGAAGYVQTLQVRLLHARVRASLSRCATASVAIDQRQMLRTWLDFTAVSMRALDRVGFSFDADELGAIYALWRVVGRLLGIPPTGLNLVNGPAAAESVLAVMDELAPAPSENARVLVDRMLQAIGARLTIGFRVPDDVGRLLANAFCRLFHGVTVAEQLGVSPNWTETLLPIFAEANRGRLARARQDLPYRQALMQETVKIREALEASFTGSTAYQQGTPL